MDAEGQKEPQGQPDERRRVSAPGTQLAEQRQAMGLSVEQIADQLKLAPRQVVALEQGDYASLPNMAVTRGFIRAYAKVVRLDPAPLVALIEVAPAVPVAEHAPIRREKMPTSFSESRFPTLTERRGAKPTGWIVGGVVVVLAAAAAAGAWQAGLISPDMFKPKQAAVETVPAAPGAAGTATTPLQAPNVPLVSTPPSPDNTAPLVTAPVTDTVTGNAAAPAAVSTVATPPAPVAAAPAAVAPAAAPATTPATTPAAATPASPAAAANPLVLTVTEDSWIEIRRPGASALISRVVKAGSTETFDIDRQSTLIVGKPDGVRATLRGEAVALPKVGNGTISRVQIK